MSERSISLIDLPKELQINIATFLRAFDLAALQQTCRFYNDREQIALTVQTFAEVIYPPELTHGYEAAPPLFGAPKKKQVANSSQCSPTPATLGYENLRDMEMLVLVRVLNMPEPPPFPGSGRTIDEEAAPQHFYVSKSWCKAALKWLESQEESRRAASAPSKTRLSRKKQRERDRRLSDVMPPWPNANQDLMCPHGDLKRYSNKVARSKRRLVDKHALKVLRKLYPETVPFRCNRYCGQLDECVQCLMEAETEKKNQETEKMKQEADRKKPLNDPLIRGFSFRASRGVPQDRVVKNDFDEEAKKSSTITVSLLPGVYHAIPRSWCQRWRKYMKSGVDKQLSCLSPDAVSMLCDRHKLPLIPDHLTRFLEGELATLFPSTMSSYNGGVEGRRSSTDAAVSGY